MRILSVSATFRQTGYTRNFRRTLAMAYEKRAGLDVAQQLLSFIEREALPGTGVDVTGFWNGFAALLSKLAPRNRELLQKRASLQQKIDDWYDPRAGKPIEVQAQIAFLREIGYLTQEPSPFEIDSRNV